MKSYHTLSTLAVLLRFANAALYPTSPIQTTTFTAGTNVLLTWKDDGTQPSVDQLPLLKVELMVDDDELVSTLAVDIKPTDYAATVNIPTYVGVSGSGYYIRFAPESTWAQAVYTANFTVSGLNGAVTYREDVDATKTSVDSNKGSSNSKQDTFINNGGGVYAYAQDSPSGTGIASSPPSVTAFETPSSSSSTTHTVPITTTPYATVAAATAGATYTDPPRKNAGPSRFQRPTAGNGLGGAGIVYLIWPFLMGVAMTL